MADWEQPGGRTAHTVGDRVRSLRRTAGLSQEELAGGRFSKEYVSQIERGKTRPTPDTLDWLADRLDTDRAFLEHGVTEVDERRLEAAQREAEELLDGRRYDEALRAFETLAETPLPAGLSLRRSSGEAWVRIRLGDLDGAMSLLEQAAALAVTPGFTDADRGGIVFQVGVVRYSQSSIREALVLFDEALLLVDGSDPPLDELRSDILHWRSRCHRRNRDWVAAEEDIERALELAEASGEDRRIADALFQASLVAQRQGRWVLARTYAERSRELFDGLGDQATAARLLNNLAGLNHLLGDDVRAIGLLEEAFAIFVELDLAVDAGYVCSSLAEVRLESGDLALSQEHALKALDLLRDRVDHLQEVGTAQLTLGRALAAEGKLDDADRWLAAADATFEHASSTGHRSSAWIAQGDLESRRGNDRVAAGFYRRAARELQTADW